jgi:NADH-quinone oxidoreductase subunit L
MGLLALGAIGAGVLQIPRTDFVIDRFLAPTFAGAAGYTIHEHTAKLALGLSLGTVLGLAGIAIAYTVWVRRPGLADTVRTRSGPLYRLFVNKWYFDELIDTAIVRPAAAVGRFAAGTFERTVIDATIVGGTTAVVGACSTAVRALQNGLLRYYAALLAVGLTAVGLYFLVQS